MKTLNSEGIILGRTNFGEADRIITMLTPDRGKLTLIAKGVRRQNSKLAGGLELFCVSDIMFMYGRGEIGTLISARLKKHYENISKDLERTMTAYEFVKRVHKSTEDEPEEEYFRLLQTTLENLNDYRVSIRIIDLWFSSQLLRLSGYSPNLQTDENGERLKSNVSYNFNLDKMTFSASEGAAINDTHIKLLRLAFDKRNPLILQRISGVENLLPETLSLVRGMLELHI